MAALSLSGIGFLVYTQQHRDGFNRLERNKKNIKEVGSRDKQSNQKQITQRFGTLTRKERLARQETAFWALRSDYEKVNKESSSTAIAVALVAKPEPAKLSESCGNAKQYVKNGSGNTDRWQQELQHLHHTRQLIGSAATTASASSPAPSEKAHIVEPPEIDWKVPKPVKIIPARLSANRQESLSSCKGFQLPSSPITLVEGTGEAGILERRARRMKEMEEARQKFQAQELERDNERRKRMQEVERQRQKWPAAPEPSPAALIKTTTGPVDSRKAAVAARTTSLIRHGGPSQADSQAQWIDPFTPYRLS